MPKIQFVGRVVPASLPPLTLPPWDTDFDDGTNKMLYKIRIIHSAVNAECETNLPMTSTLGFIALTNSLAFVRASLNLYTFAAAEPRAVVIDHIIEENGNIYPAIVTHSILQNLGTAVNLANADDFNKLVFLALTQEQHYAIE